jgi:hypothetical protein
VPAAPARLRVIDHLLKRIAIALRHLVVALKRRGDGVADIGIVAPQGATRTIAAHEPGVEQNFDRDLEFVAAYITERLREFVRADTRR